MFCKMSPPLSRLNTSPLLDDMILGGFVGRLWNSLWSFGDMFGEFDLGMFGMFWGMLQRFGEGWWECLFWKKITRNIENHWGAVGFVRWSLSVSKNCYWFCLRLRQGKRKAYPAVPKYNPFRTLLRSQAFPRVNPHRQRKSWEQPSALCEPPALNWSVDSHRARPRKVLIQIWRSYHTSGSLT